MFISKMQKFDLHVYGTYVGILRPMKQCTPRMKHQTLECTIISFMRLPEQRQPKDPCLLYNSLAH